MKILPLALTLAFLAAPARAESPEESRSPYRLQLYIDVPIAVASLGLWLIPQYAVGSNVQGSWCGTSITPACDPGSLNALDRLVVGHYDANARPVSDAFFALPALFAAAELFDVGPTHWRSW